ncbi:transport protein Avl9-domain-containing protein [Spinellus fusiger]|nr:transport protein Avl9-domain-containing protein [Spinellus fusiger]
MRIGLLCCLQNSGAPYLDTDESTLKITEAKELTDGVKSSLLRYMGLPLRIFEKGSFFQPYLPLQQIDMLSSEKTKSYLAGTTNQIFFHHKSDTNIDVLVNVETGTIEFYNQHLASIVHTTMADRRWMEKIVKVVNDTWDTNDPGRPLKNTFYGSDDYLRVRFEEYILSLLSSMKHAQASHLFNEEEREFSLGGLTPEDVMRDDDRERNYLSDYGMNWAMAWRETNNFRLWNKYTDHEIYEIIEPGHPGMGNISINDIQNTLSNRLKDLQLRQNLAPLRQTFSKAMSGGAKAVFTGRSKLLKGMDALWTEIERPAGTVSSSSSSFIEPNLQHAGGLFSNFSSFLSRKQKEFIQAMDTATEKSLGSIKHKSISRSESPVIFAASDDDSTSTFVDVAAMYPFPPPLTPTATTPTPTLSEDASVATRPTSHSKNSLSPG